MAEAQKLKTFLWYDDNAEEAAIFYVAAFKDSKITHVMHYENNVLVVEFTLAGVDYVAMNGGPRNKLSDAVSIMVSTNNQAETDRLWNYLVEGGMPLMCGWLRDKFGLSWQIVPVRFMELMREGTTDQQARVMSAMMQMVKFDIAALEVAAKG
jgi:predicted 3-demethylubiquinone-9 3-methyltransferase (glyoxalase superfamily)